VKIALVHKRLDLAGGTERDLLRTAEGLRDLGHEVHLFCSEYGVSPPEGMFAHRVPVAPFGRTARLWSFALIAPKIIERHRCNITISFGRLLSQDILRSGGGSHRDFLQKLAREGGSWRRLWQRLSLYHWSLLALEARQFRANHYKRILAVSEQVKRELSATYAIPEEKIAVIYNGVDHKRFHPALRQVFREPIKKQWDIPLHAPTVLFVGNGFRRKGLDRLLKAWALPQMKDTYLLVVGDDAQRRRYRVMAERLATGKVVFVGKRDNVESYYGAADLVALPAVQEAFGNVVLEALASGLPVVVSQAVGASEILSGSLAEGVVAHPENPDELSAKLLALLERSRDPECAIEARRLGEDYSWKNHFAKLDTFLKGAFEQGGCEFDFPQFIAQKKGSTSLRLLRAMAEEPTNNLMADPDRLFESAGCEIIKDQKKIKVGRIKVEIQGEMKTVYLKRYNAFSWRYRLGSLFRSSGAVRSLKGAAILAESNIRTARPLAAVESRSWGMLNSSFFLSQEIKDAQTADAYWREKLLPLQGRDGMERRKRFLRGLGELFRSLHTQDVYHNDLKDANILVRSDAAGGAEHFYLLDLEGIRRHRNLNRRRRIKNLVQLNRTLGRYLRPADKIRFLEHYLGPSLSNPTDKRAWVARVLRQSKRLDRLRGLTLSTVAIRGHAAHES
jgi:UDP-glucose:(heptosyl)LPS alpha-1,3-glucosyltransferase